MFLSHKDEYPEYEQASLKQLYLSKVLLYIVFYHSILKIKEFFIVFIYYCINTGCFDLLPKLEELRAEAQQQSESAGTVSRSKATASPASQQISVTVVTEFVRWNEEAISRCILFSSQVCINLFTIDFQSVVMVVGAS